MSSPAFKNTCRLEYTLTFVGAAQLTGRIDTESHQPLVWSYYHGLPEPTGSTLTGQQHDLDAEKQAMNILANRIYRHLACTTDDEYRARIGQIRRGEVTLFSALGPCHSCREVLRLLRADLPTVSFEVTYRNSTRDGGSARLLAAGDGLSGAYGFGDAEQVQPGGQWRKSFPGVPVPAATAAFWMQFTAGPRVTGAEAAVAGQPYTSCRYPRARQSGTPDEVTAVVDQVAAAVWDGIAPGQQFNDRTFPQFVRNVGSGELLLVCEQGPSAAGQATVAAFVADFPKVRVQVDYPGAAARSGGLGYADAVQAGGGWRKVFPAG
ncbi:hypothetical protein OHV05_27340 [Kitasatospora sp. NBC_00070]|uniref:hypothetical protein n=1 Tax=Kitasatospora sp. NBC_00070 TaxID=2975962 RepID=UPI0032478D6A